jgi:Carboxypeptidase regulatory-like domain
MKASRRMLAAIASVVGSAALLVSLAQIRPRPRNLGGEIHGFVATPDVKEGDSGARITASPRVRLPQIQVRAKNISSNQLSAPVRTNVYGYFKTPKLPTGRYQLCVDAPGFVSNCNRTIFNVASQTIVLNFDVPIAPVPGAVQGRVVLKDPTATPCFVERQIYGTEVSGKVWLENGSGTQVAGPVQANSDGQYVLPKIPGAASYQLKASCESGQGLRSVALSSADLAHSTNFDVAIGDRSPVITSLTPMIGGKYARRADPQAMIDMSVQVADADRDTLHYKWASDTPGFVSADAPAVQWKLPNGNAVNVISVQVTDGKGGYAFRSISIQSGPNEIPFTGVVRDRTTGKVLPGAEVSLLGGDAPHQIATDNNGSFRLAAPEAIRYVLNVNKQGYGLVSRIFFGSATSLDILMDPAQKTTIDAGRGGTITFERKSNVQVRLAAGSLVDPGGNKVSGPVVGYALAYDMDQANPIPGDLSAKTSAGKDARLESFGAIDVTFTDSTGIKLHLAPGSSADISFSIPPAGLVTAPAVIPLLTYNEATGYWMEEGTLRRSASRYEGKVQHFSAFNADTVFTNTSCLEFNVADHDVPSFPFVLHVDYATAGGPRHNDFQVTETNNVLQRLPPNTLLTISIFPGSGPGAPGGSSPHVLGILKWNSGADTGNDTYPVVNYASCNGFDTAPLANNAAKPADIELVVPGHNPFITGFGPGNQTTSDAYYKQLGVLGGPTQRDTFQHWKATNGFNDSPTVLVAGEANTQYFNNGDLQLGRDMHCLKTVTAGKTHVACYVSNYGNGPIGVQGDPQFGVQSAVDKLIPPLATVCMEYDDRGLNPSPVDAVQFYVYHADGTSFENPILDSELNKFLPQNCMACHGGNYNSTTNLVEGASFLAFDIFSFDYDNRVAKHKALEDQQEQFRQLNAMVKATKPNNTNPNNPIVSFLNGIYAWGGCNVDTSGCRAQDGPTAAHPGDQGPFTPTGWQTNSTTTALYQTIPRPYCRTCHLAQPSTFPPDWTSFTQMTAPNNKNDLQNAVCVATEAGGVPNGSHKFMPHAEVPFKAFWFSNNPSGPAFLGDPVTGINLPANGSGDHCPR